MASWRNNFLPHSLVSNRSSLDWNSRFEARRCTPRSYIDSCRAGCSIDRDGNFASWRPSHSVLAHGTTGKVSSCVFIAVSVHRCTCCLACNFLNNPSRTLSVKFAKNCLVIRRSDFMKGDVGVLSHDFVVILDRWRWEGRRVGRSHSQLKIVLARLF